MNCCVRFGFGGGTVQSTSSGDQVSFNTTEGGESQFLKGSQTCTLRANASLVLCLFRHSIKKLWR